MPQTSKTLPTLDYVSIVASLYKDRRAMLVGMAATILAVLVAAYKTGSPILYLHALAFAVVTGQRYFNMAEFSRNPPAGMDAGHAAYWERQAAILGAMTSLIYGSWCFFSLTIVRDPFAELTAVSVTVAAMIGIVTRNFGIDRLVTVQSIVSGLPLAAGLVLVGSVYHVILAALLAPTIISFRFLASNVRVMLLDAVHGRLAASRMADQLDTALETMHHGLCMLDGNGVVALANDRAMQTFVVLGEASWVGQSFSDLLEKACAEGGLSRAAVDRLNRMIAGQTSGKIVLTVSDNYHCEVTVSSRGNRTVLLFDNVTERVRTQERISFMARHDELTGVPNRSHFTEQVEAELVGRIQSQPDDPVLLAIIDLDDFKHVNDTLGHLMGDKVLAETAARLSEVIDPRSRLARMGGDEFVIYRDQGVTEDSAREEAAAILGALANPYPLEGEKLDMRASVGYVIHQDGAIDIDDLITRADLALYRAKSRGKGQYQAFLTDMDVEFRYRQRLKADLADAIAQRQLKLVYQPLVDLRTRQVAGCEALARWTHPELGPIPPNVFIGLAEEVGLVSQITRWVLKTATAECINWPSPVSVSVNVSARDLRGEGLLRHVAEALMASGLAPRRLEIEVTETALIEERDVAAKRLAALAERGIGIALDDFGTGYSSLSYLHEMPFTRLKIDRSFIADITTNPRSLKLIANVARLGKDLGLELTAEGVETEGQLETIARNTQVDLVQGYLFGMPLPAGEVHELITRLRHNGNVDLAEEEGLGAKIGKKTEKM